VRTTGHKVLITGGATGIGLALAQRFHKAGNQVIVVGRGKTALDTASAHLPGVVSRVGDVSDPAHRSRLVEEFADISVLVNNAGIQRNGAFSTMSASEIESELAINLAAPVMLCHAFLPHLVQRPEAAIVNVSSVLAIVPKESAAIYCASKAALHSFSRTLRWQLERTQVRVFEVLPALVDTAMTAGRGKGKISPDAVAAEFWAGFQADRTEIFVGKAKAARFINRLSPALAERIIRPT
jgi:uncharacterized oxidoreductase